MYIFEFSEDLIIDVTRLKSLRILSRVVELSLETTISRIDELSVLTSSTFQLRILDHIEYIKSEK
jgi:hypothetical protein